MKIRKTLVVVLLLATIKFKAACSFGTFSGYTTDSIRVISTDFYKGRGVVFPATYTPMLNYQNFRGRFTPTDSDIVVTEKVFLNGYNELHINDPRFLKFKRIKNVKREFRNFNRQYLGYYNEEGERIIMMQLLNFSKISVRKHFEELGWREGYIFGFGRFYERNRKHFLINLDRKKLTF